MKIAQLIGRGIEGCGVSRFCNLLYKEFKNQGHEVTMFNFTDKKWPRAKAQKMQQYENVATEDILGLIDRLNNEFDLVCINSIPSISHSTKCQDDFLELVRSVKTKKVMFQNDHKLASIRRNAHLFEICDAVDKISTFGTDTPFFNKLKEELGESIVGKYIHMVVLADMDNVDKSLWLPLDKKINRISYFGRYATFKAPWWLFEFIPRCEKEKIGLEMKGIERSIGAVSCPGLFLDNIKYSKTKKSTKTIDVSNKKTIAEVLEEYGAKDIDELTTTKRDWSKVYMYGPYDLEEGMDYLRKSMCAADFYHLDAIAYGDNIEYAQIEPVMCGTIELATSHFLENNFLWENGKKTDTTFKDADVFLGLNEDFLNVDEVVDKYIALTSDQKKYDAYVNNSFECLKKHCDPYFFVKRLLEEAFA